MRSAAINSILTLLSISLLVNFAGADEQRLLQAMYLCYLIGIWSEVIEIRKTLTKRR